LSIASAGVSNSMLANPSLTVTAGSGLSGGGAVALGGSTSLSIASGGVTNAMLANPSLTVTAGSGLSGGGAVALGGSTSLSIASGGVTNAMLANPSLTVTAGTDLTGGGSVALGSSVTLNLDTTKVPTLGAASNTFTGSVTASSFTGSGSGLTGLNASNLGSGALPSSVLSGTYSQALTFSNASNSFSGNGAGLTSLTPANLSAGTAGININGTALNATNLGSVAYSNYARLDIGNNFNGNQGMAGNLIVGGTASKGQNLVLEVQGAGGYDALTVNSNGTVGLGTGVGTHITTANQNTDFAGVATLPPSGSVTVTFNYPFSQPPVCVATPVNPPVAVSLYVSPGLSEQGYYSSFSISTYSNIGNNYITVNYICVGNPN
jgi:hypothetical protein